MVMLPPALRCLLRAAGILATPASLVGAFLLAGLVMLAVEPPFVGADELYHWDRILQLSRGDLLAQPLGPNSWGGAIDKPSYDFSLFYFSKYQTGAPIPWQEGWLLADRMSGLPPRLATVPFPSTATFSPLGYAPQTLGLSAARAAGRNILIQFYAARLANLCCYLFGVLWISRLLPFGCRAFVLTACLPGMLHVATTLSADPVGILAPSALIALVLAARAAAPRRLPAASAAMIFLTCLACGLLKPGFVVFTAVVLLLPAETCGGRRAGWLFRAACVGAGLGVTIAWNLSFPFVPGLYWGTGADPAAMLRRMLAAPADVAAVLFRTISDKGRHFWKDAFGRFGGHPPPYSFFIGYWSASWAGLVALILSALAADRPARPNGFAAAWMAALALGYAFLMLVMFLVGFTNPGDAVVNGIQGRYFVPALILLTLALGAAPLPRRLPPGLAATAVLAALAIQVGVVGAASLEMGRHWTDTGSAAPSWHSRKPSL